MLPQRLPLDQMQVNWAQALNPIIANPLLQGQMISATLATGANVINHKLGRKLVGWFLVGINAPATIYDTQATNQSQALTLQLTSSAAAQVNLWVF